MSAAKFKEIRTSAILAAHLASGASSDSASRSSRLGVWGDLARDWDLWSNTERTAAIFLLMTLATIPAFLLIAGTFTP